MAHQNRRVLAATALAWTSAGVALVTLAVLAASSGYRVALVGRPFNRSWAIDRGQFHAEWMTREPNGSMSGFGNPGWQLVDKRAKGLALGLRPRLMTSTSGTYHVLRIPLWPIPIAGVAAWWWARRTARRALDPAHCRGCGYPRTGLNAGSRYPECGLFHRMFRRLTAMCAGTRGLQQRSPDGSRPLAHPR